MQELVLPFSKVRDNKREIAITYYRLLSAYYNLGLTDNEVKLLAHLALYNGVASGGVRKKFMEQYTTVTKPSLDNTISRLKKKGLLEARDTKDRKMTAMKPRLILNLNDHNNFKFEFSCALKEIATQTMQVETAP